MLLHGWGMTPAVFDGLKSALEGSYALHMMPLPGYCGAPTSPACTVESLAQSVAERAPARCFVAGWSLGGQVAIEWARRSTQQVQALALIASTPSFVQRDGWTHAVEPAVFHGFADAMHVQREATLKRFASLQAQGDAAMKEAALHLRASVCGDDDASSETLLGGLRVLLETDLRETLRDVPQETLVIHGECDRLVPFAAGEHLARTMERATLSRIAGAAHATFVTRRDAVAAALEGFFK